MVMGVLVMGVPFTILLSMTQTFFLCYFCYSQISQSVCPCQRFSTMTLSFTIKNATPSIKKLSIRALDTVMLLTTNKPVCRCQYHEYRYAECSCSCAECRGTLTNIFSLVLCSRARPDPTQVELLVLLYIGRLWL